MTNQFDRYKATLPLDKQIELESLRGVCLSEIPIPKIKRVTRTMMPRKEADVKTSE
jgi:hypothetical protein